MRSHECDKELSQASSSREEQLEDTRVDELHDLHSNMSQSVVRLRERIWFTGKREKGKKKLERFDESMILLKESLVMRLRALIAEEEQRVAEDENTTIHVLQSETQPVRRTSSFRSLWKRFTELFKTWRVEDSASDDAVAADNYDSVVITVTWVERPCSLGFCTGFLWVLQFTR